MTPTILLVEDNPHLQKINGDTLAEAGYRVLQAQTAGQARALFAAEAPDLIVLDILLPDGDGLALCREIRGGSPVPILFLSAKGGSAEIVEGLRAGGDDYLPKPYDLDVLLARVQALLRRTARVTETLSSPPLTLDLLSDTATLSGQDLRLSQKEFALLLLFLRREGETLPADFLYEKIWHAPMAGNDSAVKNMVYRLRRKLTPGGLEIAFLRGRGYVFLRK